MLTSVAPSIRHVRRYPELEGARVLVTGVSATTGVDIARAFAEVGSRLVVQIAPARCDDEAATTAALLQVLANTATEVRASEQPLDDADAIVKFAQGAAQAYGGLDAVINIITPPTAAFSSTASVDDIEDAVSASLRTACLVTRIAANRMGLTWTEGLILNAVLGPAPRTRAEAAGNSMLGLALATMTRVEAGTWAAKGLRINAIGPRGNLAATGDCAGRTGAPCLSCEADIAALALHLASRRGQSLSGHVFDAEGVATRRC
jgi:NAD(P)-dependent dehydrogenase (short-subunit alcohol dehydrogenase family)